MQKLETFLLKNISEICEKHNIAYSLVYGSVIGAVRHQGPIPWDSDIDIIISAEDRERFIQACEEDLEAPLYLDYYPKNEQCIFPFPRLGICGVDIFWVHIDVFFYSALPENCEDYSKYFKKAIQLREQFTKKCNIPSSNRNPAKRFASNILRTLRCWRIRKSKQEILDCLVAHSVSCSMESAVWTTEPFCLHYGPEKTRFEKSIWENTILVPYDGIQVRIPRDYDAYLTRLYGNYMSYPPQTEQDRTKGATCQADEKVYQWLTEEGIL